MSSPVKSPAEMAAYMQRAALVREAIARLGRGSQQSASFDIRVSPSVVSGVLRGRVVDDATLEKLEVWAAEAMARQLSPVGSGEVPAEV